VRGGLLDVDEDEALVDAVRAGDQDAFRRLVDRHRDWLTARCRRHLGGDAHAAEDVAQECFVALQRTLVAKDAPMRVRPWLSVVARNRCIDETRKLRAVPTNAIPETAVFDPEIGTEDEFLTRAWNALTGRHRAVLELRELGGLSYEEIAANLAVTSGAVEALLFRARSALRREYARAGGKVASMAPMQEAVARASGHKGVLTALAERADLVGSSGTAEAASQAAGAAPGGPSGRTFGLLHELQARLLTTPGVDAALAAPPGAGGGRLRGALAAAGLVLGSAGVVAGTVAGGPSDLPVTPPPVVVTVPDASAVTTPSTPTAPTAPTPPSAEAPPADAPEAPAEAPDPSSSGAPSATVPTTGAEAPSSATTSSSVVDVPGVVEGTAGAVETTVGGAVDVLTGLLSRGR
jgi:RNA polymerase sigma-70 factor, ECF subfamily